MAFELSEAYIYLGMDTATFETRMEKVRDKMAKLETHLGKVTSITSKMAAVGGVAMGLFVKEASEAQETTSKFESVFKQQSGASKAFAAQLAMTIKRSKYDLMGYMATLQDTFVPLGFARGEAAALSQKVTVLTEDLASFNNLPTVDVLRSLQSALVGNHETVRKFGVIITEATLNQELLNMGVEGGVRAASNQQKALARLNIIMASTTDAQGDAIRTSGSFANQLKGLRALVKDLSVEIGSALIPMLTGYIEKVRPAIAATVRWITENKDLIATYAKWALVLTAVGVIIPKVVGMVVTMVRAVKALIAVQAALFAMSGPAGWAALIIGVGLATTAIITMNVALEDVSGELENITATSQTLAGDLDEVKNAGGSVADTTSTIADETERMAKAVQSYHKYFMQVADKTGLNALGEKADNIDLDEFGQVELALKKANMWNSQAERLLNLYKKVILEKQKEMDLSEKAKKLYEQTRTPVEIYKKQLEDINFLLKKNLIDQETYSRAVKKLHEDLQKTTQNTDAMRKQQQLADKAKRIYEQTRTPLEKYNHTIKELKELLNKKLIDNNTFKRAAEEARKELEKASIEAKEKLGFELPKQSVNAGFTGASDMWQQMASSIMNSDINKQQLDESKRQTGLLEKQSEHMETIAKNSGKQLLATVGA